MVNDIVKIKIDKSFLISIREDLHTLIKYLKKDQSNIYISSKISRDIFHLGNLIENFREPLPLKGFFLNSLVDELNLLIDYLHEENLQAIIVYKSTQILNKMITKYF